MKQQANTSGERGGPILNTIAEACGRLKCGRTTVYKLIDSNQIVAVKLGAKTMITEESLRTLPQRLPRLA